MIHDPEMSKHPRRRHYDHLLSWLGLRQDVPRDPPSLRAELERHVHDAEAALAVNRQALAELEARKCRLALERQRLQEEHERIDSDVDLAVAGSKDDLARFALRRAMTVRHALERISNDLRGAELDHRTLSEQIARQQVELVELQRDAGEVLGRSASVLAPCLDPVSQEEIELELLRRKRRLTEHPNPTPETQDAAFEL